MAIRKEPRYTSESILTMQNRVLEKVANKDSLKDIMKAFTEELDLFFQRKTYSSILLLDQSGTKLLVGAAPSLPQAYNEWAHGKPIGPKSCSFGTAVYRKEIVIVPDISISPLWEKERDEALRLGLQACWSVPIFIGSQVIGTFAMYHPEPSTPTSDEVELTVACARIVGLVMQREQKEKEVIVSEKKLTMIAEHTNHIVCIVDQYGIVTYGSPSHAEVLGYTAEEYEGMSIFDLIHPDDTPKVIAVCQQGLQLDIKLRYRHKQGHYIMIQLKGKPVVGLDNEIICVVLIGQDITERKCVDEELHQTKEMLESFIENNSDVIVMLDLQGKVLRVNPAFEKIYGWTKEEVVNRELPIVPPGKKDELQYIFEKTKKGSFISGFETIRQRKDGSFIDVSLTYSPIRDQNHNIIAFSFISRDITERKKTEELLRKSDRLAVIGQLAAAVAHEIRNPLMSLKGFVQLLSEQSKENLYNSIMLEELSRIEMISNEFLILAKPQARMFKSHDIRTVLRSVITLAEIQGLMSSVQITTELEVDVPFVLSDDTQLKQVFLNVMKNAIEAMPNGGRILIQLQKQDTGYLLIRFIDEGCGIPEERMHHIGEPFYSTKEKGTGLGLMISYKIIQEHQGEMRIYSKLGEGTCVTISLPLLSELSDSTIDNKLG